jgi:hypothetical protein
VTRPVITYPDPQLATRDLIRQLLAAQGVDADVSTRDPAVDDAVARPRPYVRVRGGISTRGVANAEGDLDISAFDVDEGAALALASLVEGLILAEVTSADIVGFSHISGPTPAHDPAAGPFALVSVTARLRPRQL